MKKGTTRDTPEPIDPSEMKQPAYHDDQASDSTPDVSRDGSLVKESDEDWELNNEGTDSRFDFSLSLEVIYLNAKSYIGYLIGIGGLLLLLAGCYNLFLPLLTDSGYLFESHHVLEPLAYEKQNTPFQGDASIIYVSDVVLMGVGSLLAWHS